MEHALEITTRKVNDVSVFQLKGDVTANTGKTIEEAYQREGVEGAAKFLLLFKDSYINSGGIASLILIASESKKKGQKIVMTGVTDHFHKIFEMVGLSKYIKIYPSEESALADLD